MNQYFQHEITKPSSLGMLPGTSKAVPSLVWHDARHVRIRCETPSSLWRHRAPAMTMVVPACSNGFSAWPSKKVIRSCAKKNKAFPKRVLAIEDKCRNAPRDDRLLVQAPNMCFSFDLRILD